MNKGLELIEAHHLFALESGRLEVIVHPQSVVHGLVEFRDGSVVAQLGPPDMRIPIAFCLAWPGRIDGPVARLDLAKLATLSFEPPDLDRFPALGLARGALQTGGAAPTVLNAANEVAVAEFIAGRLGFLDIARTVEETLELAVRDGVNKAPASVDDALEADEMARRLARELVARTAARAS